MPAQQIWQRYLRPLTKLQDKLRKDKEWDSEMAEADKLLKAATQHLFAVRDRRNLAEARAKDKGQVCWEVFHPRTDTPLSMSWTELPRHAVRTPNTIIVHNEYWTLKAEPRVTGEDVWKGLEQELHQKAFVLESFQRYARDVDQCLRLRAEREARAADLADGQEKEAA